MKIDELESDLKEVQNSTTSVYGNQFLENENLMLSVKVNELQQQLAEANNKLKRASETPRKNRRREEAPRQAQSPAKRNKVSEFDLDDPSKCNTQLCCVCSKGTVEGAIGQGSVVGKASDTNGPDFCASILGFLRRPSEAQHERHLRICVVCGDH